MRASQWTELREIVNYIPIQKRVFICTLHVRRNENNNFSGPWTIIGERFLWHPSDNWTIISMDREV